MIEDSISKLINKRKELEYDIYCYLMERTDKFRDETGRSITSLYVDFIDITCMEDKTPKLVPTGVRTTITNI